jgi:hypothetical protein
MQLLGDMVKGFVPIHYKFGLERMMTGKVAETLPLGLQPQGPTLAVTVTSKFEGHTITTKSCNTHVRFTRLAQCLIAFSTASGQSVLAMLMHNNKYKQ